MALKGLADQLDGGKKRITKHGATANQGQVINLVEIEFAVLMNSLPSQSNTNTVSFISFNDAAAAPSLRARRDGAAACQRLGPQPATLDWTLALIRVFV